MHNEYIKEMNTMKKTKNKKKKNKRASEQTSTVNMRLAEWNEKQRITMV